MKRNTNQYLVFLGLQLAFINCIEVLVYIEKSVLYPSSSTSVATTSYSTSSFPSTPNISNGIATTYSIYSNSSSVIYSTSTYIQEQILNIDILKQQLKNVNEISYLDYEGDYAVNATQCPNGYYCDENASIPVKCDYCSKSDFTVTECSIYSNAHCNATCPPGKYGTHYAFRLCMECPVGTFKNISSSTQLCRQCMDGTFANETGMSTCRTCPNGTYTSPSSGYVNCSVVSHYEINLPKITVSFQYIYMIENLVISNR